MSTTEKILESLIKTFPEELFTVIEDSNAFVDKALPGREFSWYPPYIFQSSHNIFMFQPLLGETFDEDEFNDELKETLKLLGELRSAVKKVKVFYIVRDKEALNKLVSANLPTDFGLFMDIEDESPFFVLEIEDSFKMNCKLLPSVLTYLANCRNLSGDIGALVKSFAGKYLTEKPDENIELQMIEKFIQKLLHSDDRFDLKADPINYMGDIERTLRNRRNIRDHYFHALNTLLIGFMFIDKYYEVFSTLVRQYGEDIKIEFLWILISLYHDIGYPSSLLDDIISQAVDFEDTPGRMKQLAQQLRQDSLDSEDYKFLMIVMNDLFDSISNQEGKWIFDGFPRTEPTEKNFIQGLCKSFIDGAHGTASTFKLAKLAMRMLKNLTVAQEREYLYRHILLASVFLMFHDFKVRKCFKENAIDKIKAVTFPLSLLLVYVDILQDDRREIETVYTRPDVFQDVCDREGKIVAVLRAEALTQSLKNSLKEQLVEALSFFEMNGITLLLPDELS